MTNVPTDALPPPQVKPQPAWQKYVKLISAIVVIAVLALKYITAYTTSGDLPACDSQGAKDGLSNIFKQAKIDFSRYISIKTLTSTKEEITCNAVLAKSAGGTADIDYRLFFEEKVARVVVTRAEDKP